MSLETLKNERKKASQNSQNIIDNVQTLADESLRVARVAHDSKIILDNLEQEFEKQTKFSATDMRFLFFATALQVLRWVLIAKINSSMEEKIKKSRVEHNDQGIQQMERQQRDRYKEFSGGDSDIIKGSKYRSWMEIVYEGVPYDVTMGSPLFGVNMEAGYHRIHTLGHDPVAGWLFGTLNILTDTITLEDFRTFKIANEPRPKRWAYQCSLFDSFSMAIECIQEDKKRLPAAVFAQGLHLASDVYTKNGLPVPLLETFSPDLAGKLYKEGYDSLLLVKDIEKIGIQAVVANLIDIVIGLVHGLYYDPLKYSNRDLYEVKTRKILLYSNVISSTSNLIWVGANVAYGDKSRIKDLDIGGLINTAYRLVTDTKFIAQVKEEFILGSFRKMIQGEPLALKEIEI